MIKFNDKTIASVYDETTVIEKIYKGTLKVFEAWKNLIASGVPPLTLTKCKGVDLVDYKIFGNSVQGENIVGYPYYRESGFTANGVTYTINDDGSITANGIATADSYFQIGTITLEANKTYTIYRSPEGSSSSTYMFFINGITIVQDTDKTVTLTEEKAGAYYIYVINGTTVENVTFYPRIVEAPTPDAPLEVESVGEKSKNLWDFNNSFIGETRVHNGITFTKVEDGILTNGTAISQVYTNPYKMIDKFEIGKTYCISSNNNLAIPVIQYIENGVEKYQNSFTMNENITSVLVYFYFKPNVVVDNLLIKMQLEEGNTPTSYEPYGYRIPVKVFDGMYWGKLDLGSLNYTYRVSSNRHIFDAILVQPNDLKIPLTTRDNPNWICDRYNVASVDKNWVDKDIAFTHSGYAGISIVDNSFNDATSFKQSLQGVYLYYELATAPTPLVQPTITNIYLKEPLRKLDTYADYIDFSKQKVFRNVEKLILNGSEYWYSSLENGKRRVFLNGRSSVKQNIVLSDKYVKDTVNYAYPDINKLIVNGAGSLIIGLDNNVFPDLETYKTWLQTNNVTIYLPLATPTEETIELPNIPTIKDTTILEVDTTTQPSYMEVVYKGKR